MQFIIIIYKGNTTMKIIGIDLGDHRTGVAYSDILGMMSTRAETITEYNREKLLNKILEIIKLEKPERIVLGLPVNMNGTEGERAEMSRAFAEKLKEHVDIPVVFWDERGTSKIANRILSDNGKKKGKQRARVDAVAATVILQSYLDYLAMGGK